MQKVSAYSLAEEVSTQVREYAKKFGCSQSELVEKALRWFFEKGIEEFKKVKEKEYEEQLKSMKENTNA